MNSFLSDVVFYRTYSRLDNNKFESWRDTIDRVIRYSEYLSPKPLNKDEIDSLYTFMYYKYILPAGRTLYTGGTEYSLHDGECQFNCSFVDISNTIVFAEILLLLMNGVGVGVRITNDNIQYMNKCYPIINKPDIRFKDYEYKSRGGDGSFVIDNGTSIIYQVGDSRYGWADSIRFLIELYTHKKYTVPVTFVFDHVRPEGYPIRGFGGVASGPAPLIWTLQKIKEIMSANSEWNELMLLDIINIIGYKIVSGSTRRSAEMVIGSPNTPFITAKHNGWYDEYPWRSMSNNSILFDYKPTKNDLYDIFNIISQYGEPGFISHDAALKRRMEFRGLNPCAEILLHNCEFCNLAVINLPYFVSNGIIDENKLYHAARLITRHAIRITNSKLSPNLNILWHDNLQRYRLIGISISGLMDVYHEFGDDVLKILPKLKQTIVDESIKYARDLRIPIPALRTTVKPDGTLSLLSGVSPGIHDHYAPHYIRRIRMYKNSTVAKLLSQVMEYTIDGDSYIFKFYCKGHPKSRDYTALEQLKMYSYVLENYAEHNVSVTVYFRKEEIPEIVEYVHDNWYNMIAVSFLPKYDHKYENAPLEAISPSQYKEHAKNEEEYHRKFLQLVNRYNGGYDYNNEILYGDCDNGVCPVR